MEKYCPSSGTEGEWFYYEWCATCERDRAVWENLDWENGCPILAATYLYSVDEPEFPKEWTYGQDGKPCCTAWNKEPVEAPLPGQGELFEAFLFQERRSHEENYKVD